jgi:hypothetical protein
MPDVSVDQKQKKLIVVVEGIERLWMLHSRLEIPLAHVKSASINPEVASNLPYPRQEHGDPEWHAPISAGTFYQHGNRVFWEVTDPTKAVVIELKDDQYAELVVQVDDPAAVVAQINQAIEAQA